MLQIVKYFLLFSMGCCILWLLIKLLKTKQPKKVLLWSAFSGLISLCIMVGLGKFWAQTIHLNLLTIGTATSLGVPGVILLMITKLLWQL